MEKKNEQIKGKEISYKKEIIRKRSNRTVDTIKTVEATEKKGGYKRDLKRGRYKREDNRRL